MLKTRTIAALLVTLAAGGAAQAGSYANGCTTAPKDQWMKIADVESRAKSDGYAVSKAKVSGSCYEIYARKDGKRYEMFYDPTTARLVSSRLD